MQKAFHEMLHLELKISKLQAQLLMKKNRLSYPSVKRSALQKGVFEAYNVDGVSNSVAPNLHLSSHLERIQANSLSQLIIILRSQYCGKTASGAYKEVANCVQVSNLQGAQESAWENINCLVRG